MSARFHPVLCSTLSGALLALLAASQPSLALAEGMGSSCSASCHRERRTRARVLHARLTAAKKKIHYCQGGVFEPCVCWQDVTEKVAYLPSDERCALSTYPGDKKNHNASVLLRGNMRWSYSLVVRDYLNNDRSPYEAALCSYSGFEAGLSQCSRWKEQVKIYDKDKREMVVCLGASGYSDVFKTITRITIKITDLPDPVTGKKPLVRLCLRKPWLPLN